METCWLLESEIYLIMSFERLHFLIQGTQIDTLIYIKSDISIAFFPDFRLLYLSCLQKKIIISSTLSCSDFLKISKFQQFLDSWRTIILVFGLSTSCVGNLFHLFLHRKYRKNALMSSSHRVESSHRDYYSFCSASDGSAIARNLQGRRVDFGKIDDEN